MIEYTEEVTGLLALQLYEARACDAIVERVKDVNAWRQARVVERAPDGSIGPALRPEARRASAFSANFGPEAGRSFDERMNALVKPLVKQIWGADLARHEGTQLIRYVPGEYYGPHTDTGSHLLDRYFSIVCYLNDDFKGGQTDFPHLNYRVVPRKGKAIVFPSTYLHYAEPVIDGEKYVLVTWLTGDLPVRWI